MRALCCPLLAHCVPTLHPPKLRLSPSTNSAANNAPNHTSPERALHPHMPESQLVIFVHLRLHEARCWDGAFGVAPLFLCTC